MYVTRTLKFIKDTIEFMDDLILRWTNENYLKSHLNNTVSMLSRIKEFDGEYQ